MPCAAISIASIGMTIPQRLMGPGARPGTRREIHNAGVLLFEGSSATRLGAITQHRFIVEFGTANAAGAMANWLWSTLHHSVTKLSIGDDEVPVQNGAIKRALLAAAED